MLCICPVGGIRALRLNGWTNGSQHSSVLRRVSLLWGQKPCSVHSGLFVPRERWTELEAGCLTCPRGSCDSQGIQCVSQWSGCQDWYCMGVLMGPCQQGKPSKCSHSFQRGALKEPAVPLWRLEGTSLALLGLC